MHEVLPQSLAYRFHVAAMQDKPLTEDVNAEVMARRTPGFSGADLSNMINEAALSAAKTNQDAISSAIIDEARDKILMGSPRA